MQAIISVTRRNVSRLCQYFKKTPSTKILYNLYPILQKWIPLSIHLSVHVSVCHILDKPPYLLYRLIKHIFWLITYPTMLVAYTELLWALPVRRLQWTLSFCSRLCICKSLSSSTLKSNLKLLFLSLQLAQHRSKTSFWKAYSMLFQLGKIVTTYDSC